MVSTPAVPRGLLLYVNPFKGVRTTLAAKGTLVVVHFAKVRNVF